MKHITRLAAAALFLGAPLAVSNAQQPMASQVTTPGAVVRVVLIRTKPGQEDAFWREAQQNLKPIYEAEKQAGIITAYSFSSKTSRETEQDWNVALTLTYPNWAALDNLGPKTEPITLKHYGSVEARTAANMKRLAYGTVVSSFLLRGQTINDMR